MGHRSRAPHRSRGHTDTKRNAASRTGLTCSTSTRNAPTSITSSSSAGSSKRKCRTIPSYVVARPARRQRVSNSPATRGICSASNTSFTSQVVLDEISFDGKLRRRIGRTRHRLRDGYIAHMELPTHCQCRHRWTVAQTRRGARLHPAGDLHAGRTPRRMTH